MRYAPGSGCPTSSPPTCSTRSAPRKGGECPTARPARHPAKPRPADAPARPRKRRAARRRDHDDGLDAYVKEVVDALPPLTDDQRDLLALIFRSRRP
jgi:hypothetical protein